MVRPAVAQMRIAWDIETNGFLQVLDRVHCLVARDIETDEVFKFRPGQIEDGARLLQEAELCVAHNGFKFDLFAMRKLNYMEPVWEKHRDTFIMAQLIWPDISKSDLGRIRRGTLDKVLLGRHSLKAWGQRLGMFKGDYAEEMEKRGRDPWAAFSEEMLDYCVDDTAPTAELSRRIERKIANA